VSPRSTEKLQVFGGDYATNDGTAIRDYIHVMDVAEASAGPGAPTTNPECALNLAPDGRRCSI
jgi:UDP-glucose 4-epimerase